MELDGLPSWVMPPPAMTLTFDLLTQKPNQCVSRQKYICDLILVKLAPIVTKIWFHPVLRVTGCCDLDLSPFDAKI